MADDGRGEVKDLGKVDLFGDEFADIKPTAAVEETDEAEDEVEPAVVAPGIKPAATKTTAKFSREIDLGDGSGKQVFNGDTADEVLDKLTEAQKNATVKIREQAFELKRQQRAQPERIESKPSGKKELTAQDLVDLGSELSANPDAAIDKLFKAKTGLTAAEIGNFVNEFRAAQETARADTAFLMNHQNDYVPSQQNANRIEKFLADEKLPHTARNLEYAFQELTESGLLEAKVEEAADPNKVAVQPHQRRKPMSTGIRQSQSSARPADANEVNAGAIKESEVEEIYKLPLEEARVKMQALMRRAKASSGQ
jgi:hypothetical protein